MSRIAVVAAAAAPLVATLLTLGALGAPAVAAADPSSARSGAPGSVPVGRPLVVTLHLPASVAAVDGRLLTSGPADDLWGVAPLGHGIGLRPESIAGGFAFGAYDLRARDGQTTVRLVLSPRAASDPRPAVVVDAMADRAGHRLPLAGIQVSGATDARRASGSRGIAGFGAAAARWDATPSRSATAVRDLQGNGNVGRSDLAGTRLDWDAARLRGGACGEPARAADANGDGCTDIVDVQAALAASRDTGHDTSTSAQGMASGDFTFTVDSPLDTSDVDLGDGACDDGSGMCTLRAAIAEANADAGDDRIEFDLPAIAPVTIQIGSRLPTISSTNGTLTIDGYSQPGSQVNTATVGSNAVMGVDLQGPGVTAQTAAFYITSHGNTIRGLSMRDSYRYVFIDGSDAHDNRVVGVWIGFLKDGKNAPRGQYGVLLNTGAHDNVVGTPDPADRNVIGNVIKGIDNYGPGSEDNVVQNDLLCIRPGGKAGAFCDTAIDHNFGPKNDLAGGTGPNERNIVGPTKQQAIEYSHGWDPAGPAGATNGTFEISGNRAIGNWLGFRADGSYRVEFRSGYKQSVAGDGQGVNIYDGARNNLIQGNFIASVFDGIQIMSENAFGNVIRDNIIGTSPLGQPAPMSGWGIRLAHGTTEDVVRDNTIANAASGGVGVFPGNVSGIRITGNLVSTTEGPAIDLYGIAGPDPNDPGDGDSGANGLLNTPIVVIATPTSVSGTGKPGATVQVYLASGPVGVRGLPSALLGAVDVDDHGRWELSQASAIGDRVTALQIDQDDDTSELAPNVEVTAAHVSGDLLASDTFTRTDPTAWGTADVGGTWLPNAGTPDYSVSKGKGRMSIDPGVTRGVRLDVGSADVDLRGQLKFDHIPVGGNAFAYLDTRANLGWSYRVTLRVASDGQVFAKLLRVVDGSTTDLGVEQPTGYSFTTGHPLAFRFLVFGTHQRFKAYDSWTVEPSAWLISADDDNPQLQGPGAIGIRAYAAQSVTNAPLHVIVDNVVARLP